MAIWGNRHSFAFGSRRAARQLCHLCTGATSGMLDRTVLLFIGEAKMKFQSGVIRVGTLDVERARHDAGKAGFVAFVLPADGIVDRTSFFEAIRMVLPLDPPVVGSHI